MTELLVALESALYGRTTFSRADLEEEWSQLDLGNSARVVREGDRIIGYSVIRERGEVCEVEGHVHPDAQRRGIGKRLATELERDALRQGAHRIHNGVFERDAPARSLIESLGYRAVRVFREMRIELDAPPPPPEWPDGLRPSVFDPERDARAFHAAGEEAFADHWGFRPRDFETWSRDHLGTARFDPTLWCLVRAGEEIAAGTICAADTYGGGWVHGLWTRRPWRRRGVGKALLLDAFGRFWERGERSIGLGVDAANDTGAFQLYERAGMRPLLGWVVYEKELTPAAGEDEPGSTPAPGPRARPA